MKNEIKALCLENSERVETVPEMKAIFYAWFLWKEELTLQVCAFLIY